jgi:hypothetical protein
MFQVPMMDTSPDPKSRLLLQAAGQQFSLSGQVTPTLLFSSANTRPPSGAPKRLRQSLMRVSQPGREMPEHDLARRCRFEGDVGVKHFRSVRPYSG